MYRLWWYVGSRDIKMEQLKFSELLIMSRPTEGYPHVYDKSKASSKDEIISLTDLRGIYQHKHKFSCSFVEKFMK